MQRRWKSKSEELRDWNSEEQMLGIGRHELGCISIIYRLRSTFEDIKDVINSLKSKLSVEAQPCGGTFLEKSEYFGWSAVI